MKTQNAKRRVPIHSAVIALGFLDFVQNLRDGKKTRLFPELKNHSEREGYARQFGEWFNVTYLEKLGIHRHTRKTAHSFRHSHATLLQEAGVALHRIEEIQGRTLGKQTVGQEHYIGDTTIETLSKDLEQLDLRHILCVVTRWSD